MIRAGKGDTAPNILTVGLLRLPRPGGRLPGGCQMPADAFLDDHAFEGCAHGTDFLCRG